MSVSTEKIYKEVFSYCEKEGLIQKLKESLAFPEEQQFNKLNISKEGLDLIDAVHCVNDKRRTKVFLEEINKYVFSKSVVVEGGIGTGILSFFASTKTPYVYGFEINPTIFELAEKIKKYLTTKHIFPSIAPSFSLKDAIKSKPPEKIDVIISENIYTGMFFEKQVQIVNNFVPNLKKGGVVIPNKLESFIILSQTVLPKGTENKDLFVPTPERGISFKYKTLSKAISYDLINFKVHSRLDINKRLSMIITGDGEINSIIIYSEVIMPSGKVIKRKDADFLNSDIIIAIQPSLKVLKGDTINVHLAYKYGSNPKNARISINKKL
jgi:predicted RNA methylase